MHLKYTNREEIRQMMIHRWIESEKMCMDLGEDALLDWVRKYAVQFRGWANSLPEHCIGCGKGCIRSGECVDPFDESRLKHFYSDSTCN